MEISIKTNFPDVQRKLAAIGRQAPFALKTALNKTAEWVETDVRRAMRSNFDRPTPFFLRSLRVVYATKTKLEAKVWFKDRGQVGERMERLALTHIEGGSRSQKGFEARLVRLGLMPNGYRAVPGAGADLDRYGNMSRGQIVKILSQLKSAAFSGDYSIKTNSKRSKAKRAKEYYFGSTGPGGTVSIVGGDQIKSTSGRTHNLPRGVWVRRGRSLTPVLLFVSRAQYRRRFDFFGIGKRTVAQRFPGEADKAIAHALRTAR